MACKERQPRPGISRAAKGAPYLSPISVAALTHLALMQIGDQLRARTVAGIYRGETQLGRATELGESDQTGVELNLLVARAVVIRRHEHPVEMRWRDRAGEEVRSLIVLSEDLHGIDVAVLPVDKPLGHLGRVHTS